MSTTAALPEPAAVAARARDILADWQADDEMGVVLAGCEKYSSDWDDFYGGPLISTYSVARDAGHLLGDALKVMASKSAVYEMTGDELAAELPVPVPVDVTCHALCAQFTALSRIQQRTGHLFVHSTVNEHVNDTPWRAGDYRRTRPRSGPSMSGTGSTPTRPSGAGGSSTASTPPSASPTAE